MQHPVLLGALFVAAALAGCLGGDGNPESALDEQLAPASSSSMSSSTSSSTVPTSSSSSTTTTSTPENRAPTAVLVASIEGLQVGFNASGSDPDGDELAWTLSFGDGTPDANGTGLPANVTHAYASAATFVANLTVTDGDLVTVANVTVQTVAEESGAAPSQTVSFSTSVGAVMCADAPPALQFGTPAAGAFWAEWEVDPATADLPYDATFTAANPAVAIGEIAFYDADGMRMEGTVNASTSPILGTVPADAAYAVFVDCAAGPASGTYHAGA